MQVPDSNIYAMWQNHAITLPAGRFLSLQYAAYTVIISHGALSVTLLAFFVFAYYLALVVFGVRTGWQ